MIPISLLLDKTFKMFSKRVEALNDWNSVLVSEMVLIDRARGAFMVHWFGTGIPMESLYLRVTFVNIESLKARYMKVISAARGAPTYAGPNLTEPLSGLLGTIVGGAVAPINLSLIVASLTRGFLMTVVGVLGALIGSGLIAALMIVTFPVVGIGAGIFSVLRPDWFEPVYAFLFHLGALFVAANEFLLQLLGPREGIKNPLIRQIMMIYDNLGNIAIQLAGAVAVLIVKVGPLLSPLARQLHNLISFTVDIANIFTLIIDDLIPRIRYIYAGKHAKALFSIFDLLSQSLPKLLTSFVTLFYDLLNPFLQIKKNFRSNISSWWNETSTVIKDAILKMPLSRTIVNLINYFMFIKTFFSSSASTPPSSILSYLGKGFSIVNKFGGYIGAPPPPALPTLPSYDPLTSPLLDLDIAGPLAASVPDWMTGFDLLNSDVEKVKKIPPNIFMQQHALLAEKYTARNEKGSLEELRGKETPYRTLLFSIIQNLLPQQAASYIVSLAGLFDLLDQKVYGVKENNEPTQKDFPVLSVAQPTRLRVVVHHLQVRAPDAKSLTVDKSISLAKSVDSLVSILKRQQYQTAAATA